MVLESCKCLVLDLEEPFQYCIGSKTLRGRRNSNFHYVICDKQYWNIDLDYRDFEYPPVYLAPEQLLTFNTETETEN